MRRILGPLLGLIILVGVGIAIFFSASEESFKRTTVEVNGLIGSEKQEFFDDPRVQARLRQVGLIVHYQKAGSRQIATNFDLSQYDYAFPAGQPAAEKIRHAHKQAKSYSPFFSPMAVATWKPLAQLLVADGYAADHGEYYTLDMRRYLDAFGQRLRWNDLPNNDVFAVNKFLLINTTDIRKSNSAAMYLALASYVLNGNEVVQTPAQMEAVLPEAIELFKRQGFVEYSSAAPFENYLVMGMGKAPMVMVYEQQFIAQAAKGDGSILPEMVLMYPEPSIFTKHTLVALSEGGNRLGEALENDPQLQQLAIEHGLRNRNLAYFREFVDRHRLPVAPVLVDVVESPSYEIIEGMIQRIEQTY